MTGTGSKYPAGSSGFIVWLLRRSIPRAPWRFIVEAVAVAFPVAMLAATLWYADTAVQTMTPNALSAVQIEMRAVSKSLDSDIRTIGSNLATVPGVTFAEPFAQTKVLISAGGTGQLTARLFAVEPAYFTRHPWLRTISGSLDQGVMLGQSVKAAPGFELAKSITISLPGDAPEFNLTLPVGGEADLRDASTWFSIPYGEVQGDTVSVPRAVVVDFDTFEYKILPVLRDWAKEGGLPPFDPGSDELPPASLESHVTVDHAAFPPDPGQATLWSGQLQKILARQADAAVVVADNAADVLIDSRDDAINAKMLFFLLGIPGVLVAITLGLTGASALVESYRREEALLRMRGASNRQLASLATAQATAAGIAGSTLGLLAAAAAVSTVVGRPAWHGVPLNNFLLSTFLAVAVGAMGCVMRVASLRRAGQREGASERQLLIRGWSPVWRIARLDFLVLIVGAAILGADMLAGGLKRSPIEGTALMLSAYVLLAPIALWLGTTLLLTRGLLIGLSSWSQPNKARPLPTWLGATARWLGRRPAHAARALITGTLAVAFATEVLAFSATYRTAREADALAAIGSDLRLTPTDPRVTPPSPGPGVASVSPIRLIPSRIDTDRKTVLAIDLASYPNAATANPRILRGGGVEALIENPDGVLINNEIATDYELGVGDKLELTIFPDDFESAKDMALPVLGIYSAFPPAFPGAEVVASVTALPRASIVLPDFYMARIAPGLEARAVAANMRSGPLAQKFTVTTTTAPNERGLTALNLAGLSLIEGIGASLVAAIGIAVLGAFLILERRREFAILHSIGADTRQILTGPALEGTVVVLGALIFGVPLGLGLGMVAVKVLGLFFALEPPLLTFPLGGLIALVFFVVVTSASALGLALAAVTNLRPASVLKAA